MDKRDKDPNFPIYTVVYDSSISQTLDDPRPLGFMEQRARGVEVKSSGGRPFSADKQLKNISE